MARQQQQLNKLNSYLTGLTQERPELAQATREQAKELFNNDGRVIQACRYMVHDRGAEGAEERFAQHYQNVINQAKQSGTLGDSCY